MVLPSMGEDAETRRIEARRLRELERSKKLGPGRLRTIGADIVGIKNQVEEKQRQQEMEQSVLKHEEHENELIRRYLIQVDSEDAIAKRKELLTLRNDWQLQQTQQQAAHARDVAARVAPMDVEGCSVGAAQTFAGEDVLRHERTRLQAMQLREWTEQQVREKQQRQAQEGQENMELAAYIAQIERLQEEYHDANERERAHIALQLQQYNQQLVILKQQAGEKQSQIEQALGAHEIAQTLASHLVSENPVQAHLNGIDHRVRVDHWKGLSVEQTRHVLTQNEQLKEDKQRQQAAAKAQAEEEGRRQNQMQRVLIQAEHEMELRKAQEQLLIRQTLEQQTREAKEREEKNAQAAKGKMESSFFQSFGKSYR